MPLNNQIAEILSVSGLNSFGIAMPLLSPSWTTNPGSAVPDVDDDHLQLALPAGTPESWVAPLSGTLRLIDDIAEDDATAAGPGPASVSLIQVDGTAVKGPGLLLTLYPHQYLRLSRLYSSVIENLTNPVHMVAQQGGFAVHPVPRYFYYAGAPNNPANGSIEAEESLEINGSMSIFDNNGFPIGPMAVAGAFNAIVNAFPVLLKGTARTAPDVADMQITTIADPDGVLPTIPANTARETRVWICNPDGSPFGDSTAFNGLNATSSPGLFTLDDPGPIRRVNPGGNPLFQFGPTTSALFGQTFTPVGLNVSLNRDYYSLMVTELNTYLLGNPTFPEEDLRVSSPTVRMNETLALLTGGNDLLAAANNAIGGGTADSLAVAPIIDGSFAVAPNVGTATQWPQFPAAGSAPATAINPCPVYSSATAVVFDNGDAERANIDVILAMQGLPPDAHVRAYTRKFSDQSVELRGNGAGGVADAAGNLSLRLKDPLGLRLPGAPESSLAIPEGSKLFFDLAIVLRNSTARVCGSHCISIDTENPMTTDPTPIAPGSNNFSGAARQGECKAAVLSLGGRAYSELDFSSLIALNQLFIETEQPREAARFPTMARRELLAAGLAGGNWSAVLGAGRLKAELHSDNQRLGCPGGLGGRETQTVGVSTQSGQLAYDMALAALRRTNDLSGRITALGTGNWALPAAAMGGTMAGAVLQNISWSCDSPELSIFRDSENPSLESLLSLPTLRELAGAIGLTLPGWLPPQVQAINRIHGELRRELLSACFGWRDSQWALERAIQDARRFIYIESPAFSATSKDYGAAGEPEPSDPYFVDLINVMRQRLSDMPGLHILICTPKVPDYGQGYKVFRDFEVKERKEQISRLREISSDRVLVFHPIGFPGRPTNLESSVIIVDDNWALIGSSTFRRRGLCFDGSNDLVFTDMQRIDGKSTQIAQFRQTLQAMRLGLPAIAAGGIPHPDSVRLEDGVEAFHAFRDLLAAGGLGRIEPLYEQYDETLINNWTMDLVNPDGEEFTSVLGEAALVALLSGLHAV